MRSFFLSVVVVLSFPCFERSANAQEVTLPAGTLVNCTLNEPNFSSASAEVGDPVICYAHGVQQFGRAVFPRGPRLTLKGETQVTLRLMDDVAVPLAAMTSRPAALRPTQWKQQNVHYVYSGTTLQVMEEDPALASYKQWQVWLYQEGVRIPRYTAGLQYSRWGVIEGRSAESVVKQLKASQSFEQAYVNFFGLGTWGRNTFFNPLGPVAVTDQAVERDFASLDERYQIDELHLRVSRLILDVQPSLENNESEGPASPLKDYFDQIRDALEQVCKLYSQLARVHPRLRFINAEIAQTKKVVAQAENSVPKITSTLPSVKLPTSTSWMSHTERGGSEGTIQVEVQETGSTVSLQQTWTGGDGSMTGTVIVTIIPFNDIGSVDFVPPIGNSGGTWTVRVQSARTSFRETMNSPLRKTATKILPAVNLTTTRSAVYFVFANSAEAQDAYAYFLYHKQLGR